MIPFAEKLSSSIDFEKSHTWNREHLLNAHGDTLVPPCPLKTLFRAYAGTTNVPSLIVPAIFLPLIIIMFASSFLLFPLASLPGGIQFGSLIPYTAFVVLATFSAQRGQQPYFFECSIVRQTMPRLIRRHIGFLLAIVVMETFALQLTRFMPPSWLITKEGVETPFRIAVTVLCFCLAAAEVFISRSLLAQAHRVKQTID